MNENQAASILSSLAHETRICMVRFLVGRGEQGAAAGEIADASNASPSRTSFHLAALEKAGLVAAERVSRQIIYRIEFTQLGGLMDFLLHDCCAGHPQVESCCKPIAKR